MKWNKCGSLFDNFNRVRDLSLFTPPLDDDKEIPYAESSMSPTLSWNMTEEFSRLELPPADWPLTINRFVHLDGNKSHSEGLFDDSESLTDKRANAIQYPSAELPLVYNDSDTRQWGQFDMPTVTLSSLQLYEPSKPAAIPKPRTRRPPTKPILKGPNPHGRAGKLRCESCRNQRQGVNSLEPNQR